MARRAPGPRARSSSPAALGFRMPAEWEPHRATWLIWPHNRADWEAKTSIIDWTFVEIVRHLVGGERVGLLCQDRDVERRACRRLEQAGVALDQVDRYRVPTNRSWMRDAGPIFVSRPRGSGRREVAVTDWRFTGWARYRAWQHDNRIPRRIANRLRLRRFEPFVSVGSTQHTVVLEGGSIDVNGRGLALTTEACLLGSEQARNPGLGRQDLERVLREFLGIERVLWLGQGIAGDDTHGHVDDIARFVAPDTVVAAVEPDKNDENHEILKDNRRRLATMTDLRGRPLHVVTLPMPNPLFFQGERLPASYLNFYIGNRVVLVPTFNDPNDRVALTRLTALFPTRQVIGIHAVDLVLGLGAIHCVTQQEPAHSTRKWSPTH